MLVRIEKRSGTQCFSDGSVRRFVVEIAHDKDVCRGGEAEERITSRFQPQICPSAVRFRLSFPSRTAGEMADEDMERIARGNDARGVENVTGGALLGGRVRDVETFVREQAEAKRLVKEGDVDSPKVVASGDDVIVAQTAQGSAVAEIVNHGVVLHLAERDEFGRGDGRGGNDDARHSSLLRPIACRRPSFGALREKFSVVLSRIVEGVVKILDIVGQDGEPPLTLCRQGEGEKEEGKQERAEHGLFVVVRLASQDGHGTVNLLDEDEANHLVGEGHPGEGNLFLCRQINHGRESVRTADDEDDATRAVVLEFLHILRKLDRAKFFAPFVQQHDVVAVAEEFADALRLLFLLLVGGERFRVLQFGNGHCLKGEVMFQSAQILLNERFQMFVSRFPDEDKEGLHVYKVTISKINL